MNTYEQKQEDRKQRLLDAADRADDNSNAAYRRADMREEASGIPFGQPILVGHHSEGRHRAAIKRADNAMRKSIDEGKRAKDLRSRAAGVGTAGISSDDPEAVTKLKEKLADMVAAQEFTKEVNAVVRKIVRAGLDSEKAVGLKLELEAIYTKRSPNSGDGSAHFVATILTPDFAGRTGYPAYKLQNNNANIRRVKQRLETLEAQAGAETQSTTLQGLCEIVENVEENRIQFLFDGKPSAEIRTIMKRNGFRWAPSQKAWQRHLNGNGKYAAKVVIEQLGAL